MAGQVQGPRPWAQRSALKRIFHTGIQGKTVNYRFGLGLVEKIEAHCSAWSVCLDLAQAQFTLHHVEVN